MAGRIVASTLNDDTGVLATQNGMRGVAKAWVNFNGTGTVAIRDSFNVSSITDNGTGDYTVNFTTAMPNANFSIAGFARVSGSGGFLGGTNDAVFATSSVRVGTFGSGASTNADALFVCVAVFSS